MEMTGKYAAKRQTVDNTINFYSYNNKGHFFPSCTLFSFVFVRETDTYHLQ